MVVDVFNFNSNCSERRRKNHRVLDDMGRTAGGECKIAFTENRELHFRMLAQSRSDSRQRFNLNRIRRSPTRRGAVMGMAWISPFSVLSTAIVLSGHSGKGLRFLHCC